MTQQERGQRTRREVSTAFPSRQTQEPDSLCMVFRLMPSPLSWSQGPCGTSKLSRLLAASGEGPGPWLDVPDGGGAWGPGGRACRSLHRPSSSLMLSNKYAAKISIKLPETLKVPHRPHNRAGEGSQLIKVRMLFEGVFLRSQVVNRVL